MAEETNNTPSSLLIKVRKIGEDDTKWVSIPEPSSYQYDRSDYDAEEGSYRDITGEMNRERIATKVKLTLSWNSAALSASEVSTLLQTFDPLFVEVRYYDPHKGGFRETKMYVGDRSLNMYTFRGGKAVWNTISFNLIEK